MKFYDSKIAPNPRRVRMFLAEKGVEIDTVEIDFMKGETKSPEYRKIAPNAMVPALVLDDGTVLQESVAICRYLESLYPEPNLMGTDGLEQAQIEMWQRKMEFELFLPMAHTFRHTHPIAAPLEKKQCKDWGERQREIATRRIRILDGELAERPFVAGERFTIADITAFIAFTNFKFVGFEIGPEQENVLRWFREVKKRPSASA